MAANVFPVNSLQISVSSETSNLGLRLSLRLSPPFRFCLRTPPSPYTTDFLMTLSLTRKRTLSSSERNVKRRRNAQRKKFLNSEITDPYETGESIQHFVRASSGGKLVLDSQRKKVTSRPPPSRSKFAKVVEIPQGAPKTKKLQVYAAHILQLSLALM
jgi:hypothetical protein